MSSLTFEAKPRLRFPGFNGEWGIVPLGSVFSFKQGIQCGVELHQYAPAEGFVRFVRIIDLTQNDEPPRYIPDPGSLHHISEHDLFMVRYGAPGLVGHGHCGVIANNLFRLIPTNADGIETTFYRFVFEGKKRDLEAISGSSTMPAINFTSLRTLKVPSPPLPEQQKIADFLTAVDGRIQQLSQKLALLQDYKKGVMQQLFTQALRFKDDLGNGFPDWEDAEFGKIAKRSSEKHNPMACETDYPSIELESLGQGTGELLQLFSSQDQKSIKSKFVKGDVLFGKLRPYLRKWLMATFDGVCSSEIWVLRGRTVTNPYLYHLIQTDEFMKATNVSSGSKMPRADWAHIAAVSFSFPTAPAEQSKIANFLTALDRKIESVAHQISHTQAFKKGLLQQMFV